MAKEYGRVCNHCGNKDEVGIILNHITYCSASCYYDWDKEQMRSQKNQEEDKIKPKRKVKKEKKKKGKKRK